MRQSSCAVGVFSGVVTFTLVLKEEEQFPGWRKWTGLPAKGMACAKAQRPGPLGARYGLAEGQSLCSQGAAACPGLG